MPKLSVKKGDTVLVIAGKDNGKKGKIVQVIPAENRVIVEGVNIVKRHTRPNQKLPQGGIVEKEAPIHVSNVMVVCPSCGKPTRVGKKFLADGKKIRICKKCGESLDK
ncbi:50S ribosomal protein L24 [Carboxydothermus pertinax]|uniref:Large ribosomal subunit protein uL24 n=1 Tax=Carboxydothermus pertinax TaxID=870242 RepID=A0A1L8CY60_9THEO|nr:50S ribosomal protein L24 [Carboxydothermus pertinax]GAV23833.1 50S ribosomal protein L24 [Carboxydothermus pertinax]